MDDVAEATMEMDLRERVVTTPIERALADFLEVYAKPRTIPTDEICFPNGWPVAPAAPHRPGGGRRRRGAGSYSDSACLPLPLHL